MENFGLPAISRELIVSKTGLVGFQRILAYTKITDHFFQSWKNDFIRDVDVVKWKMKNVVKMVVK